MAAGDVTQKFGTSQSITCTLASLASSATAGRQSALVDLASYIGSNPLEDVWLGATFKLASGTPSADRGIYVYIGVSEDGTNFGGDLSGSDGAYTEKVPTNLTLVRFVATPDSGALTYRMQPRSLLEIFGSLPREFALVVRNYSGVALDTTGSSLSWTPAYRAIAQS